MTRCSPRLRGRFVQSLALSVALAVMFVAAGRKGRAQDQVRVETPDPNISVVEQAECLAFGDARTARHARTGKLRSITTAAGRPIPHPRPWDAQRSPEEAARAYLSVCGSLFGLDAPAAQLALRDQGSQLVAESGRVRGRRAFVRFQQAHRGVPIVGGELNVHLDESNNIVFVGGKALPAIRVDTTPTISPADAVNAALELVARAHGVDREQLSATTPALWVFNPTLIGPNDGPTRLVWRMDVTPRALLPIRELVLIDAHQGGVALHFNQVDSVLNRLTYTANHGIALPGTPVCNELNPACTGGDTDAVAAHVNAGDTYNFYLNTLGRNGIDNAGLTITSTVHYSTNYLNAFWNGAQMVYGDGYPVGDDVVGHELTHGVTQYTSGLFSYYQSGAINESMSDVFGELIDQTNARGNDSPAVRWLMGEDLPGGALRNMANPPAFGDPDRMTSPNYYGGASDNGGVHQNTGVNNKAAFLMVDGGSFNGQTITGLGATKVAKIYYEVQTRLLTSGSDYGDLFDALYQGCNNLVGTAGISAIDCQQVRNATVAVEMNLQPTAGANPEAAFCAAGKVPSTVFTDGLETGTGNWTFGALTGSNRWGLAVGYSHSGTRSLYANDAPAAITDSYAVIVPGVGLPANAFLHFAHAFDFDMDMGGTRYWDGGVLEYSTNGGVTWTDAAPLIDTNGYRGTLFTGSDNPLRGRAAFAGSSHGYISTRLNLQSLAGQSVRFRWRMGLDSLISFFGWLVDDVRIYTCGTPTVTADSVTPNAGTGASQTFSLHYSDSGGAADLTTAWAWITPSFDAFATNSCFLNYTPATNALSLLNEAGAYVVGSVGSPGTLQNSQCAVALGSSTAVPSGNGLTLNLALTFTPAFAGPKSVYMFGNNAGGASSGWIQRGTWTVPSPSSVSVAASAVAPNSGSGASQTFALQYSDTAGATDLSTSWAWITPTFLASSANSCLFYYTRATHTLSLLNDAGGGYAMGMLGSSGTLQNSQCSIGLAGSSAVLSGNDLTLNLPMTFASSFAGPKTIFMYGASTTGINSGWQARGTWTVPVDSRITPTITWPAPAAITYGTTLGATQLNATANAPGTFVYTPPAGTLLSAGAGQTLSVTFTPTNPATYTTATATVPITVVRATPVITWPPPSSIVVGTPLGGTQLNATTTVPGTFSYSPPGGTVLAVGASQTLSVTFTPADGANYTTATAMVAITVVPVPVVTVTADSVTPNTGSGASQTFALRYSDTAGATDLASAWVWINASFANSASSCLFYYTRATNTLSLLNDAADGYFTGTVGSGTVQNSQCAIALGSSTAVPSGTSLTLNLAMTFAPSFAGAKTIFMYGAGNTGANSGWQTRGTWTVTAGAGPAVVTADSVTPNAGSGSSQTFAFRYSDTAGASDLSSAWVWINASFANSANSCFFYYTRATNTLALLNDAADAYLTATLGSSGTLQNSQCAIGLASSAAVSSGNTLTLNLAMTFAPSFAGAKTIFMYGANGSGVNSGWQTRGTWTVTAGAGPAVVTADSVTPNAGSGSSQTFAFRYSDTVGANDLATTWMWINASFAASSANSCLFNYTRATNTLALLNDAASGYATGTVGSGGTLQNSQCSITLGSSTAVFNGNSLTLNLPITFAPSFAGAKTIFMFAVNGTGTSSGWQTRGAWTVP